MKEGEMFAGAQFGDHYLCRDGRHALFLSYVGNPTEGVRMYHEGWGTVIHHTDGRVHQAFENKSDIVARCRGNGWEPVMIRRQWLSLLIDACRMQCDALVWRDAPPIVIEALKNRIAMYEEELANLEEG